MEKIFTRPHALLDVPTHYCPGCPHGIVHRLVAETLDELGIEGKTVGVAPVGCAVMAYNYFGCDMIEAPHGRAPSIATGVKRCLPDDIVFTYQGDGDLAAIGTAETPADPMSGFIGSFFESLFISFAIITPAAVPTPNAVTPRTTIFSVSAFRKVSAFAVAPTDTPRSMVIMFMSSFVAVFVSLSVTPHSLNRFPSISIPTSVAAGGSISETIIVTAIGNIIFSLLLTTRS